MEDRSRIILKRLQRTEIPLPADSWDKFEAMLPSLKRSVRPWAVAFFVSIAAALAVFVLNISDNNVNEAPEALSVLSTKVSEKVPSDLSFPAKDKSVIYKESKVREISTLFIPNEAERPDEVPVDVPQKDTIIHDDTSLMSYDTQQKHHKIEIHAENELGSFEIPAETGLFTKRFVLNASLSGWADNITSIFSNKEGMLPSTGSVPKNSVYSQPIASSNHSVPFTVGMHIGFFMNSRIALTSGIDLKSYYSRITYSGKEDRTVNQHAYYLGVPLKMDDALWSEGPVSVWMGVGTEVERCLYAVLDGKQVSENAFHVSAMTDLSIQYKLSERLFFYFEPELKYSFKTPDSRLLTYRTEHPLMFTVGVGLRMSL